MNAVLMFGDSRYPAIRHEVPVALPDPIIYLEHDGARSVCAGGLDIPRMTVLGADVGFDVVSLEDLGYAELLTAGLALPDALDELVLRACQRFRVDEVTVPRDFPVSTAERLRAGGVAVKVDGGLFDLRRRRKTAAEIDGIRRGERAAEAAMVAVREGLRELPDPTAETLRHLAHQAFIANGAVPHDMVVIAPGPQGADPHEEGHGPIDEGVPIVVDVFPRDLRSGCWGDLTRTVCRGTPPEELVVWHRDVRQAQRRAIEAVRPGISGEELNQIAIDALREHGYLTRRDTEDGAFPAHGFTHYLGHGLGLDLHENPTLDDGGEVLIAGDVITIEPGLYRADFGGCRIEDVVLVTEDGGELISSCPYDLTVS